MAFDQSTRNRLQRFVTDARRTLEEEFTRQLQNDYGLDPISGTASPLESLRHINDQQRETARILRDTLAHYCAGADTDTKAGLDRIVREQAFTVLNRLAALRMAEARGLLMESVGNGYQAKGFQLYARLAGTGLGETGDAYRVYLQSVFDELSQDLPGLFDRYSPQGRLFPREAALIHVLTLINHGEIEPLWAEDETIGWIYQYFNSKEERKEMRDASQAPRNSRELAVRNQFFTPRYVVEFLVDNTLGRLWFNWTGGQTGLRDRCQYLLVKPDEQPETAKRLRDPRTIKLLDPACGSMHFGLYAFDLFLEIYREAWAWEQTHGPGCLDNETGGSADLKPLSQTYADQDAFLHDVPRLIIEHNIYGVDIDPRAAQIASLALWLRAQRAWHQAGVKAKDRPQVGRGHVVAAVAPPAEVDLRKRFMEELDPLDAKLFEQTLFMLKDLPELGVLLQVEKQLPTLVRRVFGEHGPMFAKEDMVQWQRAEARLREALTDYARAARSSYQGRLFAEDALQGLRMIDHCRELFDVIVMNPPFGEHSSNSKPYCIETYGVSSVDIYCSFIARANQNIRPAGLIGIICPRSFLYYIDFAKFREIELLEKMQLICSCELGIGILDDATVRTSINIISPINNKKSRAETITKNLNQSAHKQIDLEKFCEQMKTSSIETAQRSTNEFDALPGRPILFSLSKQFVDYLSRSTKLDPISGKFHSGERVGAATIVNGLQTNDDFRFIRTIHEVGPNEIHKKWYPLFKSVSYSPYEAPISLLVNWSRSGREIKSFIEMGGNSPSRYVSGEEYYPTSGAWFPGVCERGNGVATAKYNAIPSRRGLAAVPKDHYEPDFLCGVMNSIVGTGVVSMIMPDRYRNPTYVGMIPVPHRSHADAVANIVREIRSILRKHNNDECDVDFPGPALLNLIRPQTSLREAIQGYVEIMTEDRTDLSSLEAALDELVCSALAITSEDAMQLRSFSNRPDISAWAFSDLLSEKAVAANILHFAVGQVFGRWNQYLRQQEKFDWIGGEMPLRSKIATVDSIRDSEAILVCDTGHKRDLTSLLEAWIETQFSMGVEPDSELLVEYLGAKSLRDYVTSPNGFFEYHLKNTNRNRRPAPIFWPISTNSGSYTLWLYYPSLTDQTLFTAVNDFIEPKLKQVDQEIAALRTKGSARSRDDEKNFEALQALELELIELRDTLLAIALTYRPNHDDGVQITAAPLWQLFRHKPWQKILKDTWTKLENGDYDWAHLAMAYWPDRVREKCETDKSLAIAHDLEHLYVEPEPKPTKARGRKKDG